MVQRRTLVTTSILALSLLAAPAATMVAQDAAESASLRAATMRVRPGDRILLRFLREREMSDSVFVNERGETAFPKLGILRVSNMTIAELQDTLRSRYAEYYRLPELQIAVLRRIVVNGEVRMPNVLMVDGAFTVRDVLAKAGGLTDAGDRRKVWVIRDGERIKVPDWDRAEGISGDLQSGDQVLVGRKSWVTMNALSLVSTAVLVASFVISITR